MNNAVRRIGITGGIGSGKSEVTNMLREMGYTVIDADEAAREAALPGEPAMLILKEEIGDGVFFADGSLDRQALAKLIFGDSIALMTVNEIFHSDIKERIESSALLKGAEEEVIFISAPLLFEAGMDGMVEEVWLVTADEGLRIRRVMERDGISEEDVRARMQNQMPEEDKQARADFIIANDGTLDELREAVVSMLEII